jgi:hypothetical protein
MNLNQLHTDMMLTSAAKGQLRILTPVGMLGYGYDTSLFWTAVEDGVDAIIVDSGSTDSGPGKLAQGTQPWPKDSYKRDLEHFLIAAQRYKIPILISSAGGSGTNAQVEVLASYVEEIVREHSLRTMKVVKIFAEIDKDHVHQEHAAGRIRPCGTAVPEMVKQDIDDPPCIVAQMGLEPYLEAMRQHADFDIIIGGRTYDPAPFAAFCAYKGFGDLGIAYHMGKILECGAVCAEPKSREILAIVREDSFDVVPLDPTTRCTALSVAAHSLYEKTRPDILYGPGGALNLAGTVYEQLPDGRTVRCRGAKFEPVQDGQYTVKLEAARQAGYHSTFFGGFSDPILIMQWEDLAKRIRAYVSECCPYPHNLKLTSYGMGDDVSMFPVRSGIEKIPSTLGVCGESKASTQAQADAVINATRIACIHGPYPGQKATAGNLAMPIGSLDIPLGQMCEFCIYHLMPIDDPVALFPRTTHVITGSDMPGRYNNIHERRTLQANSRSDAKQEKIVAQRSKSVKPSLLPELASNLCYLGDYADVVRSKNAGPYEVTFDVMFESRAKYDHIRSIGVLSSSTFAELYCIPEDNVVAAIWWPQALAFKATLKRPIVSGSFGETDTHGSCQHVRLMYLQVPIPESSASELELDRSHDKIFRGTE